MKWQSWKVMCLVLGIAGVMTTRAGAEELNANEILRRSFEHQYAHDLARVVRLIQKDAAGTERETHLEMAQKTIDGKVHSLTRFLKPASLRGMRILTIEADGRSDDHFIFLKSQQRVRRVRTTRQDAFLGTDFSMEDLEKRVPEDFELTVLEKGELGGESVFRIKAVPLYESGYAHMVYTISKSDFSNLKIEYFKEDATEACKELRVPRESIEAFEDVLIGRHAYVKNYTRRTETHIYLDKVILDPDLADSLFSSVALNANRKIPGL